MLNREQIIASLKAVSQEDNADVFLYFGQITHDSCRTFISVVKNALAKVDRKENALLIIATYGGIPDSAYRIGRFLQKHYSSVKVAIDAPCKSSGTLLALAAHEIIMSDDGELGPLDIQYLDRKENEFSSTQNTFHALNQLRNESLEFFRHSFIDVHQGAQLSLSDALQTATGMATEILKPIYEQIDPNRLGELSRAAQIANAYGSRLNEKSKNLKDESLSRLIAAYPSHGFIIDSEEAQTLFERVSLPSEDLQNVLTASKALFFEKIGAHVPIILDGLKFLSEQQVETNELSGEYKETQSIEGGEPIDNEASNDVESQADSEIIVEGGNSDEGQKESEALEKAASA